MEEKRQLRRFPLKGEIGFFPNRERYLCATGIDISREGLRCRSPEPVEPYENVLVMIGVPRAGGNSLLRCEGYVAHVNRSQEGWEVGFTFQSLEESDRNLLDTYLDTLKVQAGNTAIDS